MTSKNKIPDILAPPTQHIQFEERGKSLNKALVYHKLFAYAPVGEVIVFEVPHEDKEWQPALNLRRNFFNELAKRSYREIQTKKVYVLDLDGEILRASLQVTFL